METKPVFTPRGKLLGNLETLGLHFLQHWEMTFFEVFVIFYVFFRAYKEVLDCTALASIVECKSVLRFLD